MVLHTENFGNIIENIKFAFKVFLYLLFLDRHICIWIIYCVIKKFPVLFLN